MTILEAAAIVAAEAATGTKPVKMSTQESGTLRR